MPSYTLSIRLSVRYLGAAKSNFICSITPRGLHTETSSPTNVEGAEVGKRMRTIEAMPFQTYQLSLDMIKKDRQEKLSMIMEEREKLRELKAQGLDRYDRRVISITQYIEKLRILADANNPRVKYNFDCGVGEVVKLPPVLSHG
jgi:large subunit ribosomal protein L35